MSVHVKQRLTADLELIRKSLIDFQPLSIILYGGYGRGEGSWVWYNNEICAPYNDYDILMILEKKIPEKIIKSIRKKLAQDIGIRWVDIGQKTPKELKKLRPSIYNYDLKYASKVIYGEEYILDQIPHIDVSKLPLEEGNILFKVRIWTFIGSLDVNGFDVSLSGDDSRFFRNQMAKAILAVVDILLLQKGAYDSSYGIRVKRLKNLYSHKKELCLLSEWAFHEKLEPKAPNMNADEVKKLYLKVSQFYIDEMFKMLSKRYKTKINKPQKLIFLWKYYPITFIKRIGFLIIKRSLKLEKQILLDIAQLYLLLTFNNHSNSEQYLKKAYKALNKLDPTVGRNLSWNEARILAAQMRLL